MFEARKPRPATSAVLARRLVSGALGLKVVTSKEQRDIERNKLKEAKGTLKLCFNYFSMDSLFVLK